MLSLIPEKLLSNSIVLTCTQVHIYGSQYADTMANSQGPD